MLLRINFRVNSVGKSANFVPIIGWGEKFAIGLWMCSIRQESKAFWLSKAIHDGQFKISKSDCIKLIACQAGTSYPASAILRMPENEQLPCQADLSLNP